MIAEQPTAGLPSALIADSVMSSTSSLQRPGLSAENVAYTSNDYHGQGRVGFRLVAPVVDLVAGETGRHEGVG